MRPMLILGIIELSVRKYPNTANGTFACGDRMVISIEENSFGWIATTYVILMPIRLMMVGLPGWSPEHY